MVETQESIDFFANLKQSLSAKRFSGYCLRGSELDGFAKYLWNIHLCESLCPGFQLLEVAFRNKLHAQISIWSKEPNWISKKLGILYPEERAAIDKALQSLTTANSPITEDYLISEMKFGFWTSLLNSKYDKAWHKIIADVFPNMPKSERTRGNASILMNSVRKLRNAALHHHSIWHWSDLRGRHTEMRALIKYICAPSNAIADKIDKFPQVYSNGMAECQKIVSIVLREAQKSPV